MKRSRGTGDAFPRLSIKLRKEIVSAHLGDEDVKPYELTGKYLTPDELHEWFEKGEDFEMIDMRNDYEWKIGRFENSQFSGMKNFRDLPEAADRFRELGNKKVVTVCTGGVRCEKASGYLLKRGFQDVYQLSGGIVSYMEKYPNKHFKGKLYVFDKRIVMDFDSPDNHTIVGRCDMCEAPSEDFVNCRNPKCNAHFIMCSTCKAEKDGFCGEKCRKLGVHA